MKEKKKYGKGIEEENKKQIKEKGMKEKIYEGVNKGEKDL